MYELSSLFFYRPQFVAELLFAETLYVIKLKRRNHFILRATGAIIFSLGSSFALPIISYNAFYLSLMFIVLAGVTLLALYFCFDEPFLNIVFCLVAGYSTQHLAYSLYQLFMISTLLDGGSSLNVYGSGQAPSFQGFSFAIYIDIYILVYAICYFAFGRLINKEPQFFINNTWLFLLITLLFFSAIILNAIMVSFCSVTEDRIPLLVTFSYSILNCVLVLILQFKLKDAKKTKAELDIVKHLWKEDREHYELAKENINIINIKCHDLKHQIHNIQNGKYNQEALSQVEKSIMIYDSIAKTGNDALDVVLSEKSLRCSQNHIALSYIVDGAALRFISDYNIYSLFGNAIDNATEYLLKIEESKRFIRLTVKSVSQNLVIHIENYLDGNLEFKGSLPRTTKGDENFHGFGLVSMRSIVESYNGDFFVKAKDHLFSIDILIPIPETDNNNVHEGLKDNEV